MNVKDIGLFVNKKRTIAVRVEKRFDGDDRLAGTIVYITDEEYLSSKQGHYIGKTLNQWDENEFECIIKNED